jgi:hypothetical protein
MDSLLLKLEVPKNTLFVPLISTDDENVPDPVNVSDAANASLARNTLLTVKGLVGHNCTTQQLLLPCILFVSQTQLIIATGTLITLPWVVKRSQAGGAVSAK